MIRRGLMGFVGSCLLVSRLFAQEPASAPQPAKAPFDAKEAGALQAEWATHLGTTVTTTNSLGIRMVLLPPGEFLMGTADEAISAALKMAAEMKADESTQRRIRIESPQHKILIGQPIRMAATEVTIAQFEKFIKATGYVTEGERYGSGNTAEKKPATGEAKNGFDWQFPGFKQQPDHAVSQVSWNDAVQFCNWLSVQEQLPLAYEQKAELGWVLTADASGYRLPSEAEWEYAARAGTTTQYHFGDDAAQLAKYGWFGFKSGSNPVRSVGSKLPNAFGLFDMHGNISEWCQDVYEAESYPRHMLNPPIGQNAEPPRVIRGGDWWTHAVRCRSAFRGYGEQSTRSDDLGFRLVQGLSEMVVR